MVEVLSVPMQSEGRTYCSPSTLPRSPSPQSSFLIGSSYLSASRQYHSLSHDHNVSISASSTSTYHNSTTSTSPLYREHTYHHQLRQHYYHQHQYASHGSKPADGSELNAKSYGSDELSFPSYNDVDYLSPDEDLEPPASPKTENSYTVPSSSGGTTPTPTSEPEPMTVSEDDSAARQEPSRHVDYLSHEWREEDIWASWRHIVSKRKVYGERSRLENASWRTWAKSKYHLRTVTPEKLNWLKDCDVTWLYGPLQTHHFTRQCYISEPCSNLSKSNSFLNKKPILKKRSVSELMLQKSLSSSSLVKQAAASVQAQQWGHFENRVPQAPVFRRSTSDFGPSEISSLSISRENTECISSSSTSGLHSPSGERKRIRFDEKVEQRIAVDIKEGEDDDDDDEDGDEWATQIGDYSSDDDGIVLKSSKTRRTSLIRHSRSNSSSESRTIAKLPDTTLKCRTEAQNLLALPSSPIQSRWTSGQLSPSPSQETIRPTRGRNFILEDEDDASLAWEPSDAFLARGERGRGSLAQRDGSCEMKASSSVAHTIDDDTNTLRRTSSGMFMPFDDDDEAGNDEDELPFGLLGRVVDTVNTARDIAHVIWNVGWR